MMRAPGRISTAWEYPGDGGSVPDLINRTADFSLTFGVSFVWFVFREPEKIDAAVRHTRMKAIRMLSLLLKDGVSVETSSGSTPINGHARDGILDFRHPLHAILGVRLEPI